MDYFKKAINSITSLLPTNLINRVTSILTRTGEQ